jgi:hypothetical protein
MDAENRTCQPDAILRDGFLWSVVGISLLVRGLVGAWLDPGIDEAYYGYLCRHPAWGYIDHPPAITLTAGLGYWLTGSDSVLALRLGALLAFIPSTLVVYALAHDLFGRRHARVALVLFNLVPFFAFGLGCFVFPDNLLALCWLLFLWTMNRLRVTRNPQWLPVLGLLAGLAMLAKYHSVFLFAGLGFCLVFFREWRFCWRSPWLYAGFLLSLLVFLPNILWNARHDWVSYAYQFGKSATGLRLRPDLFAKCLLGAATYLLPWNMALMLWAMGRTWRQNHERTRWLLPFAIPPIAVFTLLGMTRAILPHWTMPGYLAGVILATPLIASWTSTARRRLLVVNGGCVAAAALVFVAQTRTGFLPLKPKLDPTLDGQGWSEVIDYVKERGYDPRQVFLFTGRYGTGGELAYAAGRTYATTVLAYDEEPHIFAFTAPSRDLVGRDGILVAQAQRYKDFAEHYYAAYFDALEPLPDLITHRPNGKPAQTYRLFYCRNLRRPYPSKY